MYLFFSAQTSDSFSRSKNSPEKFQAVHQREDNSDGAADNDPPMGIPHRLDDHVSRGEWVTG